MQRHELKALTALWYKKLKDTGFQEIESGPYLKEWHAHYFQTRITPDLFQVKQQYFISASHFLITYTFETDLEKQIWQLHSEGKSYREIADDLRPKEDTHSAHCRPHQCEFFCPAAQNLNTKPHLKLNKDNINVIILRLRKLMLSSFGGEVTSLGHKEKRSDSY